MVVSKEVLANLELFQKLIESIGTIGVKNVLLEMNNGTVVEVKCEDCCVEDHEVEVVESVYHIELPLAK